MATSTNWLGLRTTTRLFTRGQKTQTDPQAARLQQNLTDLRSGLASIGREDTRLIPLPLPEPVYFRDMRLPASYCNFVITNQQVIVPQFKTASDQRAMEILGPLFPDREVIGLPSFTYPSASVPSTV